MFIDHWIGEPDANGDPGTTTERHGVSVCFVSFTPLTQQAKCDCGEWWHGTTYERVEDEWRAHLWAIGLDVPHPSGNKVNRWEPPA